jgi:hypothetical protein
MLWLDYWGVIFFPFVDFFCIIITLIISALARLLAVYLLLLLLYGSYRVW